MDAILANLGILGLVIGRALSVSAIIALVCSGIFERTWFKSTFGKGVGGAPSRIFPNADPRPYIAVAIGIWVGVAWKMMYIAAALGYTPEQVATLGPLAVYTDYVLTGIGLGMGPKFWLALGRTMFKAQTEKAKLAAQNGNGNGTKSGEKAE